MLSANAIIMRKGIDIRAIPAFLSPLFLVWYISRRSPRKDAFSPMMEGLRAGAILVGGLFMLCSFGINWLIIGTVQPEYMYSSMELLARYTLSTIVFVPILYFGVSAVGPANILEKEGFAMKYRYDYVMVGASQGLGYAAMESMMHLLLAIENFPVTLDYWLMLLLYMAVFLIPMFMLCGMSVGYHYAHYKFDGETYPHARKAAFIEPAFIFFTYRFLAYYFWYYSFLSPIRGVAIYFLVPLAACFVWWYAVTRKRSNKMLELDKEIVDSEPIEQETETENINQEQENK